MAKEYEYIKVKNIGNVIVVNFKNGKIDEKNAEAIGEELWNLIDSLEIIELLINFTSVHELPVIFFRILMVSKKKIEYARGRMIICDLCAKSHFSLGISELNRHFNVVKTEKDAIHIFNNPNPLNIQD